MVAAAERAGDALREGFHTQAVPQGNGGGSGGQHASAVAACAAPGDIRAADAPACPRCAAPGDSAEPADADTAARCAEAARPRNILPEAVADGVHECVDEGSIL